MTVTAEQPVTDSPPVALETLSRTAFRDDLGQLAHDVCADGLVLRVHDPYGEVFYVTRDVPESVRQIVDGEPPFVVRSANGHARVRRPAAEVLAPLGEEEISLRYSVSASTARQWRLWARRELRQAHAVHASS